ncbi:MAG TPA: ATP-dependent zinc metalloprotease FtsH [Chloroflexota bacterium]|jgi:cell division protease FtsH|nr:ATP-dependent zinc metalloprotease FtsH [Chloroflexota bacterium]
MVQKRGTTTERPRPPGPEAPRPNASQRPPQHKVPAGLGWAWILVLIAFLVANYLLAPVLFPEKPDRITIPYTTFREQVEAGNVVEITSQGDAIQGTFREPVTYPPTPTGGQQPRTSIHFETRLPTFVDPQLDNLLREKGVVINARPLDQGRGLLWTALLSFGPALLFFALLFWMASRSQQAQAGVFGLGRSRARRYQPEEGQQRITFADVAGIDEAKQELQEIVDFLKNPDKYRRLGGTIPKGVLLVGPPGTGKTLLARAVAGEANVPFFSMSGSEFIEMIVGVGAARVRDLFEQARKEAPSIVFVDELDAIGRRRGAGTIVGGGHDEREQTLNQLLVAMDGFDAREAVIVLAATNRPDVLDPALLRPGRFDRRVVVPRPDRHGREEILKVHTRGVPLAPDVDLGEIAAATPGLVGADLRNLVNEAALLAARRDRDAVTREDFFDALEKIALGTERKLVMSPEDRKRTAYHEAGHALVGLLTPEADPVHKVTIVPRGQALGVTYSLPVDDRLNYTEPYLRARIAVAMGGRVAEELVFHTPSTGAENDFQQATQIARQMVTRWGMSPRVGPLSLAQPDGNEFLGGPLSLSREISEALAQVVDEEVRRILDECYQYTRATLSRERARLEALAAALLARESLEEREIREVTGLAAPEATAPAREPLPAAS